MDATTEVRDLLRRLARREGVSQGEILRRGVLVVEAARQQREAGRSHLGFSSDPHALDLELLGVLG